jgi:cyclopropane fatty-acyl-phospholipid synthase-like methyltransferase
MMGQHNRAMSGQADHLVENLNLEGVERLIDLGGGAASYSMALCEANPQLSAVVVDGPEPIAIARSFVAERGLEDRISLIAGDFFEEDLGSDYDVALISGVVLIKSEQECRQLFDLAHGLLKPGGMVVVQDFMRIGRTQEQAKADVLENLYVKVVFDPGASDRDGDEVASWLADAGFQDPRQIPIPAQLALITATKPD